MRPDGHLAILIPGFPKDEDDWNCLPNYQALIRSLNKEFPKLQLTILSFQYPFEPRAYKWNGNTVIAFGGKNRGGFSRRILWHNVRKKLSVIHQENKIEGLLCFWAGECTRAGIRWARKNNVRCFGWVMGQDAKKDNKHIRATKPLSPELISISDFNQKEFEQHHGIRPQAVIPMGVEPIPGDIPSKRTIDIFCAGSLIPLKQYTLIIDIVREIKTSKPDVQAWICGKGPEGELLRSKIKEHKLENNIHLKGELKHPELLQKMKEARVFLHPSSYEGFSASCLEALAAGMHVISFIQPMKDTIKKWTVVKSVEEMSDKTIEVLNNEEVYQPFIPFTTRITSQKIISLFS